MSTPFYEIYIQDTLRLANSLVVKSAVSAVKLEEDLQYKGLSLSDDPKYHIYYMNLAGEYHPSNQMMTVVSTDTLETIAFTKENLEIHRATAKAYQFGSVFYNELLARYPKQEMLIYGVLNPVDKQTAIDAPDGKVLYYEKELVLPQERTLIEKLDDWLSGYTRRWTVSGYNFTDEYYPAAILAPMYASIPLAILNIRLEACGTNEAHDFHIREYLASNGRLDRYINFMTLKQKLFFYRNIRYIFDNIGTEKTFELLTQYVMTDRQLPLSKYVVEHDVETLIEDIYPKIEFKRIRLNNAPNDGMLDVWSLNDVVYKENELARGNPEKAEDEIINAKVLIENATTNTLQTKVIESSMLDATDSVPYTFEDTLMAHWCYYASLNRINAVINVIHPITGQRFNLSAKEAFLTQAYFALKKFNLDVTKIPKFIASRVMKPIKPTLDDFKQKIDMRYAKPDVLMQLTNMLPTPDNYVSISAFYDHARDIYDVMNKHRLYYSSRGSYHTRGAYKNASRMCFFSITCDLFSGEYYDQFFMDRGLDLHLLNKTDGDLLYASILTEVFDGNAKRVNQSLAELQRAMVSLLSELSSYSLQFVRSINTTDYRILDIPVIRVGDVNAEGESYRCLDATVALRNKSKGRSRIRPAVSMLSTTIDKQQGQVKPFDYKPKVGVVMAAKSNTRFCMALPRVTPVLIED